MYGCMGAFDIANGSFTNCVTCNDLDMPESDQSTLVSPNCRCDTISENSIRVAHTCPLLVIRDPIKALVFSSPLHYHPQPRCIVAPIQASELFMLPLSNIAALYSWSNCL